MEIALTKLEPMYYMTICALGSALVCALIKFMSA